MLDSLVRVSRRVLKVPKAIASPTGESGSVRDTPSPAADRARRRTRSDEQVYLSHLRRAGRELNAAPRLDVYRRASGPEHAGPIDERRKPHRPGSTAARRPAPDGSRRPTRGEVHAFRCRTDAGRARPRRTERRADAAHPATGDAVESPPSTFRVSQVYP